MSISAITVFILTVCSARVRTITINDEDSLPQKLRHTYDDLSGEDIYVDKSHTEHIQETSQNAIKVDRDDSGQPSNVPAATVTGKGSAFNVQGGGGFTGTHSAGNSNFGGHANTFNLGGLEIGNSFPTFSHATPGAHSNGGGYSFNGGSSFGPHNVFPATFGHGGYPSGGGGSHGSGSDGGYNNLQPVIHKSVYVHIAPPEEEVPKQRVIVPKVPPKKNYQIVFIKAPTPPPPSVPVIPPFPSQSDKTLIYVLHPKPEEAPPIHIPAPPQNIPVKPEVYFIRYKTKKEEGAGDGGYHRRYGRDDEEIDGESLDATETEGNTAQPESDVPQSQYDEQNDSSGESSNIVRIYTTERGKNAH